MARQEQCELAFQPAAREREESKSHGATLGQLASGVDGNLCGFGGDAMAAARWRLPGDLCHTLFMAPTVKQWRTPFLVLAWALVGMTVSLGCGGPVSFIPGGRMDGTPARVDPTWSNLGDSGICQLETNPDDPYSVTVAYTVVDGQLYVNAGGSEKRWAKNAIDHPDVRLRIDGKIYELRAVRVTDPGEIARFASAWTGQSFFRRDPTAYDEVFVFRLVPRPKEPSAVS